MSVVVYTVLKKNSIKNLITFSSKFIKKEVNEKDDLYKLLDSLEIMTLLSAIEKNFRVKINIIKLLNNKKLDLKKILSHSR